LFASVLDRAQQRYLYVTLELEQLLSTGSPTAQPLFEECSDVWINVFQAPTFVRCTEADRVLAVVISERSGYRHLELVHRQGRHEAERELGIVGERVKREGKGGDRLWQRQGYACLASR